MSNLLSQAFQDALGSTPLLPLEPSHPSIALKACNPSSTAPSQELPF